MLSIEPSVLTVRCILDNLCKAFCVTTLSLLLTLCLTMVANLWTWAHFAAGQICEFFDGLCVLNASVISEALCNLCIHRASLDTRNLQESIAAKRDIDPMIKHTGETRRKPATSPTASLILSPDLSSLGSLQPLNHPISKFSSKGMQRAWFGICVSASISASSLQNQCIALSSYQKVSVFGIMALQVIEPSLHLICQSAMSFCSLWPPSRPPDWEVLGCGPLQMCWARNPKNVRLCYESYKFMSCVFDSGVKSPTHVLFAWSSLLWSLGFPFFISVELVL